MSEVCKVKTCADFSTGPPKQGGVLLTASLTPVAPCGQTFSSSVADLLHIYTKSITERTRDSLNKAAHHKRETEQCNPISKTSYKGIQNGTQKIPLSQKNDA